MENTQHLLTEGVYLYKHMQGKLCGIRGKICDRYPEGLLLSKGNTVSKLEPQYNCNGELTEFYGDVWPSLAAEFMALPDKSPKKETAYCIEVNLYAWYAKLIVLERPADMKGDAGWFCTDAVGVKMEDLVKYIID